MSSMEDFSRDEVASELRNYDFIYLTDGTVFCVYINGGKVHGWFARPTPKQTTLQ